MEDDLDFLKIEDDHLNKNQRRSQFYLNQPPISIKKENNLKLFVDKKIMQHETFKSKTMVMAPLRVTLFHILSRI